MQGYIPGQGMKKPLNMLEQPVHPDIKAAPPEFKWSGKHWTVDVGQTLLDTEAQTQTYEHAVLAVSRDQGRDGYGHSSYQEKIDAFRPPLENYYEHHGPLNRLPTKITAIYPRINPGTAHSDGGSSAFAAQNQSITDLDKHISDRISTNSWRATFYAPIEMPEDNSVLPDLLTTLPTYSASAGCESNLRIDAPRDVKLSEVQKPQASASAGYDIEYYQPLTHQTSTDVELRPSGPQVSGDAGFYTQLTIDGDRPVDGYQLDRKAPMVFASAGHKAPQTIDGETHLDEYVLDRKLPSAPISSGYNAPHTVDGETRLDELDFETQLSAPLSVINPGSETGYQTRIESYTPPEQHLKLRENPRVPVVASHTYDYKDRNADKRSFHFQTKIQPEKSYHTNLNGGTIRVAGVEAPQFKLKYDSLRSGKRLVAGGFQ